MSSTGQQQSVPDPARSITDLYENPYYLHSSDHADLIHVSDRLSCGLEFHSWRRSMRMALNVCNKLGFIDGRFRNPLPIIVILDLGQDAMIWW